MLPLEINQSLSRYEASLLPFPCATWSQEGAGKGRAGHSAPKAPGTQDTQLSQHPCVKQQGGGQGHPLPCCVGSGSQHSVWESLDGHLPSIPCCSPMVMPCAPELRRYTQVTYDPVGEHGDVVATGCMRLSLPLALPSHSLPPSLPFSSVKFSPKHSFGVKIIYKKSERVTRDFFHHPT